ncbi:MAG TPA: BatA domain-containing protein [Balneolaceae bacterium]|nr:BatA domain-containing protein [Balneolaceae bacterium]
MNFLNPFFLFGLVAVAIPIVIHLINLRRPQKISFSTLSFFNELRKSTIRRIRIKQYLLMALRALAVLFLALALARPFLPPTLTGAVSSGEPKAVAILIDNSASMSRIGSHGPLIDQAKDIADRILRNGTSDDRFLITTTNEDGGGSGSFIGAARARKSVSEVTAVNTAHYTKEKFKSAYEQLQSAPQSQAMMYIISDGQQSQLSDLKNVKLDDKNNPKPVSVQLITLQQAKQQNLAVSSLTLKSQMLSKGSPVTLAVDVQNVGEAAAANQFVSLEVEGEMSGQYEVSLQPGETKEFTFQIVPDKIGDLTGRIIIEGDEVGYDNTRYFVIRIPKTRSILLVNDEKTPSSFSSYLAPALEAARQTNAQISFDEKPVDQVDQSHWQSYDGIVLDGLEQVPEYWFQALQRYVQNGKGVLFFPSEKGDIGNYNKFFTPFNAGKFNNVVGEYGSFKPVIKMAALKEGHPILNDLFSKKKDESINVQLPSVYYYYRYREPSNTGSLDILKMANGDPLLEEQQFGKGVLLISSIGADPGWSNFPVNPLFAPLYYRSILYASSSENGGLQQHSLGTPFIWQGKPGLANVTLELNNVGYRPEIEQQADGVQISYEGKEWKPGIVTVNAGDEKYHVAVNQNIMESQFGTLQQTEWKKMLQDKITVNDIINAKDLSVDKLNAKLNTAVFGKEIWNWFIWIALLFLIIETVVSRMYKAESIT